MPTTITAYRRIAPDYNLLPVSGFEPITLELRDGAVVSGHYLRFGGQPYTVAEALALGLARIVEPTEPAQTGEGRQ